jgi:hypothetical protein
MKVGSAKGGLDDIVEVTQHGFTVMFDEMVGEAGDYVFAIRDDDEVFSSNSNINTVGELVSSGIPVTSINLDLAEAGGWPPKHVRRSTVALEAHLAKLDLEGNRIKKKKKKDRHDDTVVNCRAQHQHQRFERYW